MNPTLLFAITVTMISLISAGIFLFLFYRHKRKQQAEMNQQTKVTTSGSEPPKKNTGIKILGILLFLIFTLGSGTIGITLLRSAHAQEKACSGKVEGQVVEYRKHYSGFRRKTYSPVVEFRAGNEMITGNSQTSSYPKPFKPGEYVTIGYNPQDPSEFYIKGYDLKTDYQLGTIFLLISLAIFAAAALLLLLGKIHIEEKKKEKIQTAMFLTGAIGFILTMFLVLAGIPITVCVFTAMGLFALYGRRKNKQNKDENIPPK